MWLPDLCEAFLEKAKLYEWPDLEDVFCPKVQKTEWFGDKNFALKVSYSPFFFSLKSWGELLKLK